MPAVSHREAYNMENREATETMLRAINPWWKDGKISSELAKPFRRPIFRELKKLMAYRQALILTGLRRVGKSTLLFQLIEDLLKANKPESILYISFDLGATNLAGMLEAYSRITGMEWKKEKMFVIIDEIQKRGGWQDELKLLYDNFPNMKLMLSGSSSVNLESDAIKALAGRHFIIGVKPLSFAEFLALRGKSKYLEKPNLWADDIRKEFGLYKRRPFPEVIGWKDEILIRQYMKESVLEKVAKGDLPERFRKINQELLMRLIESFYLHPGMYINYDALASDMKVGKKTLLEHVFYLEFAYLIRRVRNFRPRPLTASRKMQRIYPYHWSLAFALGGEDFKESMVASFIDAKYYWRDGGKEVDFVSEATKTAIEVKSGEARKEDASNLAMFSAINRMKAVVVHDGPERKERIGGVEVSFVPFWKFALAGQLSMP